MARKYSISGSEGDGDLGYIERSQRMTKEEEELLFKLSEGKISEVIKNTTNNSFPSLYTIYKIEDKIKKG